MGEQGTFRLAVCKVCPRNLINVAYLHTEYPRVFFPPRLVGPGRIKKVERRRSRWLMNIHFLPVSYRRSTRGWAQHGAARAVLLSTRVGILDQCRGHASFVLHPAPSSSPRHPTPSFPFAFPPSSLSSSSPHPLPARKIRLATGVNTPSEPAGKNPEEDEACTAR